MKKFATLNGGFFCEACNKSTGSKFCIDCGNKCIEAFPNAAATPPKKLVCACGAVAPTVTTRFCIGCGASLQAGATSSSAIEEEKRKKMKEEEQKRLQVEAEQKQREAREAAQKAEAEARRKQEEEARAKAEEEKKKQEELKQQEENKRKEAQAAQVAQAAQRKPQARFCIECGARSALPTAKFCVQCGKTFEDPPGPSTPKAALPPVPTAAPPALPASPSPRSPPSASTTLKKKPPMPTLRAPLRPPCRKCGAPTGPRFCTACGATTEEEDKLRAAGLSSPTAAAQPAQISQPQAAGTNDEAESTRALRAMLEEREKELKRMQELLQSHQQNAAQQSVVVEEPSAPAAPPPAPDFDASFLAPSTPTSTTKTLSPSSLHDQLKTATLKKTVVGPRPKSVSTSSRLRGATFLGAMERIQAATSKDLDEDDDDGWDGD